jgi:hypothetical protein
MPATRIPAGFKASAICDDSRGVAACADCNRGDVEAVVAKAAAEYFRKPRCFLFHRMTVVSDCWPSPWKRFRVVGDSEVESEPNDGPYTGDVVHEKRALETFLSGAAELAGNERRSQPVDATLA